MYVLVQHYISDPVTFWSDVRYAVGALPPRLALHHVFPTGDGTHAVCIWEAESVRDVKAFVETYVGHVSRNLYFQVENRESIALPGEVELPRAVPHASAA
ncbi:MAG: hypothetical protein JO306_01210 [Gemmatimonadetes bacterium]|nr:hypothetical protein [Gemmatimonadota bacterium]